LKLSNNFVYILPVEACELGFLC